MLWKIKTYSQKTQKIVGPLRYLATQFQFYVAQFLYICL